LAKWLKHLKQMSLAKHASRLSLRTKIMGAKSLAYAISVICNHLFYFACMHGCVV